MRYDKALKSRADSIFIRDKRKLDITIVAYEFFKNEDNENFARSYNLMNRLRKDYRKEGVLFGVVKSGKGRGLYGVIRTEDQAALNTTHHLSDVNTRTQNTLAQVQLALLKFPALGPILFPRIMELAKVVTDIVVSTQKESQNGRK